MSKSMLEKIATSVKDRRIGEPVRFVYDQSIGKDTLKFFLTNMGIDASDSIIPGGRYHNRRDFMDFPNLGRFDLLYEPKVPLPVEGLSLDGSILNKIAKNNNMGEIIKVFMITSSGSEGINLRNTRYVHIMEPYWHPVRSEQVIGRARRICSHKALPLALQTVEVFVYLMIFTPEQLKSDDAIELKRKDLSKAQPHLPITSDQYLYEISEIKANLTAQLTEAVKESAFDCYIYSNGKCVNFGDPTKDKFSYVPDYSDQQNDTTVQANKEIIQWTGKPIRLNGVDYVYRRISKKVLNVYDKLSYEAALLDPSIIPLQIGTLEKNDAGEDVFKQLVV
jgi:hypothetical protein